ncbi:DUF4251 domain-containing protein [Galbibacter sp. EGI 63066]|uniref:DUF4251 domain-containing protein n=1 Tax=Galbibacter sp. EGI 63066 TaxID=2993559 RepID=UPI0022499AF5|nr:DUF4251 domain-containing protein [Galbibacter sp. EGI 63066]MCX2680311.1 DUF4251 domain-containing protein [Galbibacter sp. EGI 63066]
MKYLPYFSCLILIVVCWSCSGTKNTLANAQDIRALDSLVQQKQFKVVNDWASPMMTTAMMSISGILGPQNNMQQVNLIGNANYLEIKGDSVKAYLPYFGERQRGGGYNPDGEGIQFDQIAEDMEVNFLEDKELYRVRFNAHNKSESFAVMLAIFPNRKTNLVINSTDRNSIRYEGKLSALEEK